MQGRVMKFKIIWSTQDMTGRAPEGAPVLGRAPVGLWAQTLEQEGDPGREGVPMISVMLVSLLINDIFNSQNSTLLYKGVLGNEV
jgi:hypothetical protein